jgi:hypothetical protein
MIGFILVVLTFFVGAAILFNEGFIGPPIAFIVMGALCLGAALTPQEYKDKYAAEQVAKKEQVVKKEQVAEEQVAEEQTVDKEHEGGSSTRFGYGFGINSKGQTGFGMGMGGFNF